MWLNIKTYFRFVVFARKQQPQHMNCVLGIEMREAQYVLLVKLWRAECVIPKTYKLSLLTDKFGSCLDQSYRNACRRASCFTAPMCQKSPFGLIR